MRSDEEMALRVGSVCLGFSVLVSPSWFLRLGFSVLVSPVSNLSKTLARWFGDCSVRPRKGSVPEKGPIVCRTSSVAFAQLLPGLDLHWKVAIAESSNDPIAVHAKDCPIISTFRWPKTAVIHFVREESSEVSTEDQ